MTEISWWFVALFFVIVIIFYAIGFWAGKNWERGTWEDKNSIKPQHSKTSNFSLNSAFSSVSHKFREFNSSFSFLKTFLKSLLSAEC